MLASVAAPSTLILIVALKSPRSSRYISCPPDGIVKETADKITAGASGDEAQARAI